MLGVIGIIQSLGLLMFFAYRGINVMVLAPIMALLAVLVGGEVQLLLPTYTQVFMRELGGYLIKFPPFFLLGAIFGKLMENSGSAEIIALMPILIVIGLNALLTYGLFPTLDATYLAQLRFGGVRLSAVADLRPITVSRSCHRVRH